MAKLSTLLNLGRGVGQGIDAISMILQKKRDEEKRMAEIAQLRSMFKDDPNISGLPDSVDPSRAFEFLSGRQDARQPRTAQFSVPGTGDIGTVQTGQYGEILPGSQNLNAIDMPDTAPKDAFDVLYRGRKAEGKTDAEIWQEWSDYELKKKATSSRNGPTQSSMMGVANKINSLHARNLQIGQEIIRLQLSQDKGEASYESGFSGTNKETSRQGTRSLKEQKMKELEQNRAQIAALETIQATFGGQQQNSNYTIIDDEQ